MLEFVELKVLLRAKEVKMYFIYMALDFARNTTEHKELWPRFRKDQNSWNSSRKKCVADYEGTFVSYVCGFIILNYLT